MQNIKRLDLADAGTLLAAAKAAAQAIGVSMCIAIVDDSGNLIAFERMDGGKIVSITIAIDKAFTAAAARRATHDYNTASQPGMPAYGVNTALGGRMIVVGGGLPVVWDGAVVGGIGVSSGTPEQDRLVAQEAIDRFLS